MSRLHFTYSMKLFYTEPVNICHFTIKCIPKETDRQKLISMSIQMDPFAKYTFGADGFNNRKITGSVRTQHDHYFLDVGGIVETSDASYEETASANGIGMFKYPYGKTIPGNRIKEYKRQLDEKIKSENTVEDYDKAILIMHSLFSDFIYDTTATDVDTTAEEAFELGRGVCQDYVHVYITLMRLYGIPARYVVGLMLGEGKSHAWAEICIGDKWIGIDPTNNQKVDENYIKIGDGRDATDCKINLGIMYGGGNQRQEIDVKVWKENFND